MPHGQPDYGMYAAKATIASDADNAELAARLGSIVTHDRRGDVIWLDNFEGNLAKWASIGDASLSADTARSGGLSCKMATIATDGAQVLISRHIPYPVFSKVGFEMSLCHWQALVEKYECYFYLYNPDLSARIIAWRYYPTTNNFQIWDNALGWTSLSVAVKLHRDIHLFHTLKIVGDLSTSKYVRLIIDETTFDLSAYTMRLSAHAGDAHMSLQFLIETGADAVRSCYVDDAIFTQNEP